MTQPSCYPHIVIMFLLFIFTFWSAAVRCVDASSVPSRPLTNIEHPITLALEVLPRSHRIPLSSFAKREIPIDSTSLLHSDHFRLKLSAFSQTFNLHLRPNDDLIHPSARISYYSSPSHGRPSTLTKVEPLLRNSILVYSGEVVHPDHTESRLREDTARLWRPPNAPGTLGWARIVVHHVSPSVEPVFEGAFSFNGDVYHIMTRERYMRTKRPDDPHVSLAVDKVSQPLVIFRDSDLVPVSQDKSRDPPSTTCGHDHLPYNTDFSLNGVLREPPQPPSAWWDNPWQIFEQEQNRGINRSRGSLGKRDDVAGGATGSNFVNSIGSTTGCPNTPKLVYMGVAADCQYTAQHGSVQNATSSILLNWNTASALYKSTFNVSLGIINIEVHDANCPTTPDSLRPWNTDCGTVTLNDRLSLFSTYRATLGNDGAGLWHLMSGCPTGTEVGIAWLGTLCNQQASNQGDSVVSGTAVSTAGRSEWQVVAHEIGHNFGAIHDCQSGCNSTAGCCPLTAASCDANSKFLMSPVTSAGEMNFSPCSIGNICSVMQTGVANGINTTCLLDPGSATKSIISLQMCGNGIVEDGEECDPGSQANSTCCDPKTCKFTVNAKCDPTNDLCCTSACQIAPASQVCRPAISGGCDIAETCSGNSSKCPSDVFKPNGQSCGANGLACANGQCTSISQQCTSVGMSMNLTTACPNKNTKTCQISCQNPQDANSCVVLQSQLIDGSPCGYGGTCTQGDCAAGPLLDTVKAWYVQNLQISIPVTIVVGIVAILIIWSLILALRRCCAGPRNPPPITTGVRGPGQRIPSWTVPPPDMVQQNILSRTDDGMGPSGRPAWEQNPSSGRNSIPAALRVGPRSINRSNNPAPEGPVRSRDIRPTRGGRSSNPRQRSGPSHWVDPSPWNGVQ